MVFELQTFGGALGFIDPVLVSASVDKRIMVWDLHTLFAANAHAGSGAYTPATAPDNTTTSSSSSQSHLQLGVQPHVSSSISTNSAAIHSIFPGNAHSSHTHSHGHNAPAGEVAYTVIPSFGGVEQAFKLDLRDNKSMSHYLRIILMFDVGFRVTATGNNMWPRLSKHIENHGGAAILAMATRLFFQVLLDDTHTDFIGKFLPQLPTLVLGHTLTDMNFDHTLRQTSLLELAIVKQDQVCLHSVVNAWIYLLQPSSSSSSSTSGGHSGATGSNGATHTQSLFSAQKQHVSVRLEMRELLGLAESFPGLCFYVCDLPDTSDSHVGTGEFVELVKNLRLIPAHEDTVAGCHRVNLRIGACLELAHSDSYCHKLWEQHLVKHYPQGLQGQRFPVSAFFVPLREPADPSMLQTYVSVCESTQSVELFNADVCVSAVEYAWLSYGRRVHYRAMAKYVGYLVVFSVMNIVTFMEGTGAGLEDGLQTGESTNIFAHVRTLISTNIPLVAVSLQAFVLCFALHYLYEEVVQYWTEVSLLQSGSNNANMIAPSASSFALAVLADHMSDIWNILDVISFVGTVCGVGGLLWVSFCSFQQGNTAMFIPSTSSSSYDLPRSILAVVSVCQWFKILYFFRAFESTGPLVSMIFGILFDVRYFFLILGIILFGFSQAFWLISLYSSHTVDVSLDTTGVNIELCGSAAGSAIGNHSMLLNNSGSFNCSSSSLEHQLSETGAGALIGYSTWHASLLQVFRNSMGDPSFDFSHTSSPTLGIALLVLFLIVYVIILLNILIALMSDTFNRIQSNGLAQWRLERCKIILEQLHLLREPDGESDTSNTTATATVPSTHNKAGKEEYIHVLKRAEFVKPLNDCT